MVETTTTLLIPDTDKLIFEFASTTILLLPLSIAPVLAAPVPTTVKVPPCGLANVIPLASADMLDPFKSIVLPDIYRSRQRLVGLPRSYVIFAFGNKSPATVSPFNTPTLVMFACAATVTLPA